MTSRERLLTAMRHELPDRTPTALIMRGEAQRAMMAHFGVSEFDEVLQILGIEDYRDIDFDIHFTGFAQKVNGRLEGDCPFTGRELYFHDERTFEDGWGVVRRVGRDGKYVEWIDGPLAHVNDPEDYDFPGIDCIGDEPKLSRKVESYKEQGFLVRYIAPNPYKIGWYLRGMENLLADYLVNRPFVEKLYQKIYVLYGEMLRRATAAGVDMIGIEGDIAMQDRIIMGPSCWREVDKPLVGAAIASCKEINPDVHVFIHSDGDLRTVMPDLIEVGFDVIDSIQPECMDPVELKRDYGDRITLHGCGSLQATLPFGSPSECRQEVTTLIEGCGYDGGLILKPSNMVGWDVPIENIIAWYEAARDYDLAGLPARRQRVD